MLFNSLEFLFIFLPIVFIVYFLLNKLKLYKTAKISLILASFYFYGSYKLDYIWILLSTILFNFYISQTFKLNIKEFIKKYILIFGIAVNILSLVFFKYFTFIFDYFKSVNLFPLDTMKIIIPLGISFFTIQQISYIIDCYKGEAKNYNIIDYTLFICFFPQLLSGPIVRHQEMVPQFNDLAKKAINQDNIYFGLFMITIGLIKKVIFADNFIDFINFVNDTLLNFKYFDISWVYSLSIILQGYFDFSGYCDIAIGTAALFNIFLPWNFNSPYQAVSITDFWRRWNMTFVRFLKHYIYYPLGSDKKGLFRTFLNTMLVFLIYGIWYGNNPVKIFYGVINGILVCINKLWEKLNIAIPKIISILITFITITLMAPLITMSSFKQVFSYYSMLLGTNYSVVGAKLEGFNLIFNLIPPHNGKINILILGISLLVVLFFKNSTQLARWYIKSNNSFYTLILSILFIFAVLSITKNNSFVYFAL